MFIVSGFDLVKFVGQCILYPNSGFIRSLKQKKEQRVLDSADKDILAEAERLEVRAMGPLILSELLFDENIREQIKKYKRHFLRVSSSQAVLLFSLFNLENSACKSWFKQSPDMIYLS